MACCSAAIVCLLWMLFWWRRRSPSWGRWMPVSHCSPPSPIVNSQFTVPPTDVCPLGFGAQPPFKNHPRDRVSEVPSGSCTPPLWLTPPTVFLMVSELFFPPPPSPRLFHSRSCTFRGPDSCSFCCSPLGTVPVGWSIRPTILATLGFGCWFSCGGVCFFQSGPFFRVVAWWGVFCILHSILRFHWHRKFNPSPPITQKRPPFLGSDRSFSLPLLFGEYKLYHFFRVLFIWNENLFNYPSRITLCFLSILVPKKPFSLFLRPFVRCLNLEFLISFYYKDFDTPE